MELTERLKGLRSFCAEACRQTLEPALYAVGIGIYSAGVGCAALRLPKARLLARGQKEVWRRLADRLDPEARYVWIHAALLGEFEQGRPLIERIRRERPEYKILLTFFSPSGYEVRKDYAGADCVCYLPFDTPGRVKRFLETVKPEKAIFVKYEIWRNYLRGLWQRQVPTYLVSAVFRPEQAFFKKRSAWYRCWLRWYTGIFVQDERSRRLLEDAGIEGAVVAGDTRFDRVADIRNAARDIPELSRFRDSDDRPIAVAGSSWPLDEEVYLPWFRRNKDRMKLVIAPHEFDDARIKKLCSAEGLACVGFSQLKSDPALADKADCIVMDCFGLLSSAYRYGDVAYVGGGFGAGIHNINEAAVYGIPVVFGPNHGRFLEAGDLIGAGGGFSVGSAEEFSDLMEGRLADKEARREAGRRADAYIRSKLGATDRVFRSIFTSGG